MVVPHCIDESVDLLLALLYRVLVHFFVLVFHYLRVLPILFYFVCSHEHASADGDCKVLAKVFPVSEEPGPFFRESADELKRQTRDGVVLVALCVLHHLH